MRASASGEAKRDGMKRDGAAREDVREASADERKRVEEELVDDVEGEDDAREVEYETYAPAHGSIAGGPHPDPVVETGTLAKVRPPVPTYDHAVKDLCESGGLSALQMESVTYACMRHEQRLPGERNERAGFFLGDGAGVGKGRQIAGLVYEHRRRGGSRVLWVSTSADLKYDAERDLNDLNVKPKIDVIPKQAGSMPTGNLNDALTKGVVFSTYSLLTQGTPKITSKLSTTNSEQLLGMIKPGSRLKQFVDWLDEDEYGPLIVFDECHKAKNLFNSSGKPTKTAVCVVALQLAIPNARVLYCSATGASEPKNLGYMTRLGHFGWKDTVDMMDKLKDAGLGALEMFACGLKATGSYLCRTLSYEKAEFELVDCEISDDVRLMYDRSTAFWLMLKRLFDTVEKLRGHGAQEAWQDDNGKEIAGLGRLFWATHQRFFRQMLLCAKVPKLAELARSAVIHENMAVVIGLQSTGEASLTRLQSEEAADGDDDFASSPAEMLVNFVKNNFPTTSCQASVDERRLWDTVVADVVRVVNMWCSQETILDALGRNRNAAAPRRNDGHANDDQPMNGARENVAAPRRAAPNDDDFEMVQEKSLDEVLAERLEAAKIAGDFLDLTDADIRARAENGVSEPHVRELERMEQANAAQVDERRYRMLQEERQLVEMNQRRINSALADPIEAQGNRENIPPREGMPSPAGTPMASGAVQRVQSGIKRPSPSSDDGQLANSRQKTEAPVVVRRFEVVEVDSSSDDEADRQFSESIQKRRDEYARSRQIISLRHPSGIPTPERPDTSERPARPAPAPVAAPAPPQDPPKPAVNALERLRRYVPEEPQQDRDERAPAAAVKREGRGPGRPRRNAERANYQDEDAAAEDDSNDDFEDAREEFALPGPGAQVVNEHLIHIRALLIRAIGGLQLPPNPLDNLIALCGGHEHVAEMTGRKLHQVRDESGKVKTINRNHDLDVNNKLLNITEKQKFQDGEKLIAIISDAASTGISLQADKRVDNQRRRCHMTLELPWSADKAIQQFGRSHRSNQSSAPLYRILMTPCGGERRFASSAAKRLLSLGALLKGDRNALGAGQNLQAFDIDNDYGAAALKHMIFDISGKVDPLPTVQFKGVERAAAVQIIRNEFINVGFAEMGDYGEWNLTEKAAKTLKISTFLNRLLGMPINAQKVVFDYFTQTFEGVIKQLKQSGKYDTGVTNIKGQSITADPELNTVVHTCEMSGAETNVRLVQSDNGVSWRQACAMKREYEESRREMFEGTRQRGICGFYIATYGTAAKTNRPYVMFAREVRNNGQQSPASVRNPQMMITRPNSLDSGKMTLENIDSNYVLIEPHQFGDMLRMRELWHFWYDFFESTCTHGAMCSKARVHGCNNGKRFNNDLLMCGATLPIWNLINNEIRGLLRRVKVEDDGCESSNSKNLKVMRAQTTLGEKIVGLRLGSIRPDQYKGFVEDLKETIEHCIAGRAPEEEPEVRFNRFYSESE